MLTGCLVDALGVRRALLLSFGLCVLTRGLSAFVRHPWLTPALALLPMALGMALIGPLMVAAVERHASRTQRPIAFALFLFYLMPRLGFLVAGRGFDWIGELMAAQRIAAAPGAAFLLSRWEVCFLVAFAITAVALVAIALWMREGAEMSEQGIRFDGRPEGAVPVTSWSLSAIGTILVGAGVLLVDVLRRFAVYRVLLLIGLLAGMRACATLLAGSDGVANVRAAAGPADGGSWWVVSELPVVVCLLLGAFAIRASPFRMILLGAAISALSGPLFLLSVGTGLRLPQLLFACGEAIFVPRLLQYVAEAAPPGRVATYASLSLVPATIMGWAVKPWAEFVAPVAATPSAPYAWLLGLGAVLCGPVGLWVLRRAIDPRPVQSPVPTADSALDAARCREGVGDHTR